MAAREQLADLADLLPPDDPRGRLFRFRLPFTRPRAPRGLQAVPDRYRLQLILMAADALPGADPADAAAAAAELAERTRSRIPRRLLAGGTDGLDRWFKDSADLIAADAGTVAASWRR